MDKVVTLLWILFALGAFVFRLIMKAQETSARESRERPTRPGGAVPELPTATFQEMLRQMQARNAAEPGSQPTPATPQPTVLRTPGGRLMPRELARPTRSQERTEIRPASLEAPAMARLRNAPAPVARRSSSLPRASAQAPMEASRPTVVVLPEQPLNETVRQMLRQPDGVRTAFVLSEIFQRKY
ncbi:hypothetical protein Q3A66_16225 [Hymenobacter sp. BT770]|uniref:hypothetical protein n=1 Tax=Hymenobacter sp. BT770 TaxID=2886942 RepID=UPI001D11B4F6|nr:hypothetical protein [Hymenobacter sp. BT770]MCC3154563.1 hypothetical protein [Hymenobacter sp. BT770]MDO3416617.1 hypothetical protein [Hymenobacter sp. BT770]